MRKSMFYGAGNLIFENAKALRNNLTHAELILWGYLKQKPLGYKFRRQHPINQFIADFYCHSLKLIIEVDGDIHNLAEVHANDLARQNYLENEGMIVIRFSNKEVEKSLEVVIDKIEETINNIINNKKPL